MGAKASHLCARKQSGQGGLIKLLDKNREMAKDTLTNGKLCLVTLSQKLRHISNTYVKASLGGLNQGQARGYGRVTQKKRVYEWWPLFSGLT